jgi:hypothetical protein
MASRPSEIEVHDLNGEPVEFVWGERRYRVHSVLLRWCEAGGWWHRANDGEHRPDDRSRSSWRVEAAPEGTLGVFDLERDDTSGRWLLKRCND